jgi:hypothetical protein
MVKKFIRSVAMGILWCIDKVLLAVTNLLVQGLAAILNIRIVSWKESEGIYMFAVHTEEEANVLAARFKKKRNVAVRRLEGLFYGYMVAVRLAPARNSI